MWWSLLWWWKEIHHNPTTCFGWIFGTIFIELQRWERIWGGEGRTMEACLLLLFIFCAVSHTEGGIFQRWAYSEYLDWTHVTKIHASCVFTILNSGSPPKKIVTVAGIFDQPARPTHKPQTEIGLMFTLHLMLFQAHNISWISFYDNFLFWWDNPLCNVFFISFLVCSEAYFVLDKFEKQSWVWNWKRPPKYGRRCAWMVPLYNMHIVSIKSKLLWERETNTEGELLYFSFELCQKSWWPQL